MKISKEISFTLDDVWLTISSSQNEYDGDTLNISDKKEIISLLNKLTLLDFKSLDSYWIRTNNTNRAENMPHLYFECEESEVMKYIASELQKNINYMQAELNDFIAKYED